MLWRIDEESKHLPFLKLHNTVNSVYVHAIAKLVVYDFQIIQYNIISILPLISQMQKEIYT